MRKRFYKGIVGILFVGLFLIPVIGDGAAGHGHVVTPTSIEGPGVSE
jgi:hypothetical protein